VERETLGEGRYAKYLRLARSLVEEAETLREVTREQ